VWHASPNSTDPAPDVAVSSTSIASTAQHRSRACANRPADPSCAAGKHAAPPQSKEARSGMPTSSSAYWEVLYEIMRDQKFLGSCTFQRYRKFSPQTHLKNEYKACTHHLLNTTCEPCVGKFLMVLLIPHTQ
jgi:hypothetical protein